jgi:hypothetical protein
VQQVLPDESCHFREEVRGLHLVEDEVVVDAGVASVGDDGGQLSQKSLHGLADELVGAVGVVVDLLEGTGRLDVVDCVRSEVPLWKERRLNYRSSLPRNFCWSRVVCGEVSSDMHNKIITTATSQRPPTHSPNGLQ